MSVTVERLPVQLFGLGIFGFDHLQIVFRHGLPSGTQDHWFVIEGLREPGISGTRLAVEGWAGGTTLSDANGGLIGRELADKIGTSGSRGARTIAEGRQAITLWAKLVAYAADIDAQRFPYIPATLPASPLPTVNSSSLVASLLYHAEVDIMEATPNGLRFSPGTSTLLGTSGEDRLRATDRFSTLMGGYGDDVLVGNDATGSVSKLYGGAGNDTFLWSPGINILHGGQPGLSYAEDGIDTVDYTGAGEIRIEALPRGKPHRQPDFIVHHATGRDYLFSIEQIIWDGARDRIQLDAGVDLILQPFAEPTSVPEDARLDAPDLRSSGLDAHGVPAGNGLFSPRGISPFDFMFGG